MLVLLELFESVTSDFFLLCKNAADFWYPESSLATNPELIVQDIDT